MAWRSEVSGSPLGATNAATIPIEAQVSPEQLIHAIEVVAAGNALLDPSVTRRLIEEFAKRPEPAIKRTKELAWLTERELEVLKEIARGFTNAEIAARLHVSETTVKTHVAHVLDKLGLRDRVQAVIVAYEAGLAGSVT